MEHSDSNPCCIKCPLGRRLICDNGGHNDTIAYVDANGAYDSYVW